MGKREQVVEALSRAGAVRSLLGLRAHLPLPLLTVLTYHRVAEPGSDPELDDGVIDATTRQFDEQLRFLGEHFRFVGIQDVLAWVGGKSLPPNPVLVTFDDGYLDCYRDTLALLEKHNAKAVFFIATDYIEKRRIFWWDRLSYLLGHAKVETLELSVPHLQRYPLASDPEGTKKALLRLIKTHYDLDIDRFFEDLERASGVHLSADEERQIADRTLMTWDQIRSLRRRGMDVQSHTRTHRVLQTLSPASLEAELAGSRLDLEAQLDEPIRALAYPVGYPIAEERVKEAIARAGYQVGFTNSTGTTHTLKRPDPFDVKRISMDVEFSDAYFRGIMSLPYLGRSRVRPT